MKKNIFLSITLAVVLGFAAHWYFGVPLRESQHSTAISSGSVVCDQLGVTGEFTETSPSGSFTVAAIRKEKFTTLKLIDTATGEDTVLDTQWPEACFYDPVWSEDGTRLYYAVGEQGNTIITSAQPTDTTEADVNGSWTSSAEDMPGVVRLVSVNANRAVIQSDGDRYLVSLHNEFPPTNLAELGGRSIEETLPFDIATPQGWYKQLTYQHVNVGKDEYPAQGYELYLPNIAYPEQEYPALHMLFLAFQADAGISLEQLLEERSLNDDAYDGRSVTVEQTTVSGFSATHKTTIDVFSEDISPDYRWDTYLLYLPTGELLEIQITASPGDVFEMFENEIQTALDALQTQVAAP